jgi:DNA-binding IclR family transcriptional regulator
MELTQTVGTFAVTTAARALCPATDRRAVRSVDRAIALLLALGESEQPVGVTDLAARIGLHKSTVARLVLTLRNGGLVEQDKGSSGYRLGVAMIRLGGQAERMVDLRSIALPELSKVSLSVKETSTLGAMRAGNVVAIAWADASGIAHDSSNWNLPLHATASGKVLLSSQPEREVVRLSRIGFAPYTSNTIVRVDQLLEELARVRQRGYATAFGENDPSVNAVAVPVFDQRAAVVAALEIRGPRAHIHPSRVPELIDRIRKSSASITQAMGGTAATA